MKQILFQDLPKRLLYAFGNLVILFCVLFLGKSPHFFWISILIAAVFTSIGVYEFCFLCREKSYFLPSKTLVMMAFLLVVMAAFFSWSQMLVFLLICASFLILQHFSKIPKALEEVSLSLFSLFYIALPLALILSLLFSPKVDGVFWVLYLVTMSKASDIGGYFGGRFIGQHLLAKRISPHKTVEGAIVGFFLCIFLSLAFFHFFFGLNVQTRWHVPVLLGFVMAILSLLGDLIESLFKRDARIKDSTCIQQIGGVLDTLDSILPNGFFLFIYLNG